MRNKKLQTTALSCFAVLMISSMSSPINALEDPQKTLEIPITDLSEENSDLSKLQVSSKKHETKINLLQRNIDVLSENVDTQEDKVSELNKTKNQTEKTLQESKEKKASVEKTLESKEENLNLLQKDYKTLKSLDTRYEINKEIQEISNLKEEKNNLNEVIQKNESIYKVYIAKVENSKNVLNETNSEKESNEKSLKEEFSEKEKVDNSASNIQDKIDNKMSSVIADVNIKDPIKEGLENTDINYIQEVNEQRRIEAERLAEEARIKAEQEAAERARIAAEQARIEAERQAAIRARGQAIVDAAMSKRGSPYVWGASGPNTFDCSGLVYWACKQAGVYFTRTTAAELSKMGQEVSLNELQPGDIITLNTMGYVSHVVIYIGNGQIVHAPQTGDVVKTASLSRYSRNKIVSCRRLYN